MANISASSDSMMHYALLCIILYAVDLPCSEGPYLAVSYLAVKS